MHTEKKILKKLNEFFDKNGLVKALKLENYQDPHNYVPSDVVTRLGLKELRDIQLYERTYGASCQYKYPNGMPCKLEVEKHTMQIGVVLLVKKGTSQVDLANECANSVKLFEQYKISGLRQTDIEE